MTPAPRGLLTPWGEHLDVDRPLPEYPRPQLRRDSHLSLNGVWEYAITRSAAPPRRYDGTIVVPFPPESLLSGVRRVLQPDEVLHYRRTVRLPAGFRARPDDRVLLHFGAVDRWCRVLVDDVVVAEHEGGYLPFGLDVTDRLGAGDVELRVVVCDPTDTAAGSRGKQRLRHGGIWYTPFSGIWQPVWCEAVPAAHVTSLDLVPRLDDDTLAVTAHVGGASAGEASSVDVAAIVDGETVAAGRGRPGEAVRLALPGARRWSPEDPFRYDVEVRVGRDVVRSYAGMRSFGIGPDRRGVPRLLLNGRPYLHAGVLDQGYWSDGWCTPPSDAAMVHDIETMKRLGFTMLRKHVKVEPLRWYYHCDRLGMLVWQDFVNGGGRYRAPVVSVPGVVPFRLRDRGPVAARLLGRGSPRDRDRWEREAAATVRLLRNSPSVSAWVPFNEGWGQFDAARVAASVRRLDPTRPVDHASGWFDEGAGDVDSRHVYVRPVRAPRRRDARVVALTEYGGYSWAVEGHTAGDRPFGYRRMPSAAALLNAFRRLHDRQVGPAVASGLAATVYTQLSDVEDETNGLLTTDRRECKLPEAEVRAVLDRLRWQAALDDG